MRARFPGGSKLWFGPSLSGIFAVEKYQQHQSRHWAGVCRWAELFSGSGGGSPAYQRHGDDNYSLYGSSMIMLFLASRRSITIGKKCG